MRAQMAVATGLLAALGTWCAPAARGQIVSMVDERGRRVFVNAESPASPGASSRSAGGRSAAMPRAGAWREILREQLMRMADEAAQRHHVDPALVRAVIEAESNWNPGAVSHKGAQGLMQLVPGTAGELGVDDPFDPGQNLEGGVRHLRKLLERYNGDLDRALAAYNAGASAVDRAGGIPDYRETRAYVQKVTDSYFRPDSGRGAAVLSAKARAIYRTVDERGRLVFTNE